MAKHSIRLMIGAFKRESAQLDGVPRMISKETADRLFVGMMRDQARFGIGRSLLVSSSAAAIWADLRGALRGR